MTKKPRTTLQRYADYKKTFPKRVNDRRCELIVKKYEGGGLDADEEGELAECERVVDAWQTASPWAADQKKFLDEKEAEFRALAEKHGIPLESQE